MPISPHEVHEGTVQYCFDRGLLVPTLRWRQLRANVTTGRQIARLYEDAPVLDERARSAYRTLREELRQQFEFLTGQPDKGGLGIKVLVHSEEPYSSVDQLLLELCAHRRVRIFGGATADIPHPLLSRDDQYMLRALFEVFGHAVAQVGFDRHGEEAAWLRWSVMFTGPARRAMTTETRGRTCALLYASVGAKSPEPKAMLLPPAFSLPDYEAWR